MTELTENALRTYGGGGFSNNLPVVGNDIIHRGAALGIEPSSGHVRPLTAGDKFTGFADERCDNQNGAAGAKNVLIRRKGVVELQIAGVVATDVGQPVYAEDENGFTMLPVNGTTSASYVGTVMRFSKAGYAEVFFDVDDAVDPWGDGPREMVNANKTLDAQDTGKTIFVGSDGRTVSLPATGTALDVRIVNGAAFGVARIDVSPAAADMIHAPDNAGANNKDWRNTKATAQRGDYVRVVNGHTDGPTITEQRGIWARQA